MRRRGIGRPLRKGDLWWGICFACLCLLVPSAALAAFPGNDPTESPRLNTPNDPGFDECEGDDPDTAPPRCTSYFEEEFRAFGFSPDSANRVSNPTGFHYLTGTNYTDCSQPSDLQKDASIKAEGVEGNVVAEILAECLMPAGVGLDIAWKYSTGSPDTSIAILDTGIRWQDRELRLKIRLNAGELPTPQTTGDVTCPQDDCNSDGAFNVADFANDSRVGIAQGDEEADDILDASDLIGRFSGGDDSDGNGYVDDIAGWDFFDDDNDPFDVSSCCSANGHGTGRGRDAAAETNNGMGGVGMCPDCQIMPLRIWDSFVVPIDNFAMATVYAADNGASVVEGAVGGLGNSQFARTSFTYADQQGVALMLVSSDINSANHNYPTNYDEAVYVAGAFPDTAPNNTCSGPGGLPGIGSVFEPPPQFTQGCNMFLSLLAQGGVTPTAQPVTTSFFRNSNLTQYGGKADIVLEATTGSENTGQAAGAAGLLASYGREQYDGTGPPDCQTGGLPQSLSGNEIRQLLTMSAEDVKPMNTGTIGQPDKANVGWDPHFGYGRVSLGDAMKRIKDCRVPPEAQIHSPDWFTPINVDRVGAGGVDVTGHIAAPHGAVGNWRLEFACGQDVADDSATWDTIGSGIGDHDGVIGNLSQTDLNTLADTCNGEVATDAGRPAGPNSDGAWPADPYPNPDPEQHAFQIRLTVDSTLPFGGTDNHAIYRKTLFAYNDDGNLSGWPRPVGEGSLASSYRTGSGGEVSPRLYDVDGDNKLDVIQPTTSGEIFVLHADGSPVSGFNGGNSVKTDRYQLELNHPVPTGPGGVSQPRESLRVPAIGDVDGDREADIVATAGEHVYAWHLDGTRLTNFPVGVDRDLTDPCRPLAPHPCFDKEDRAIFTNDDDPCPTADDLNDDCRGVGNPQHIKRGFVASPALADLDCDGSLDIVAGALDQHLYAWNGDGDPLPGYPFKLESPDTVGAEIITSPSIAELDGRDCSATGTAPKGPEVITATNEVIDAIQGAPPNNGFPGSFLEIFNILIQEATGANPVYAVHGDAPGTAVTGWPVEVGVAAGDLLPFVLPGHDSAVLNTNGGTDEVSVSAATSVQPGGTRQVNGAGQTVVSYEDATADSPDQGPIINLADYQSVGNIQGMGGNPVVFKGGLTVNGAANLLAVNQNLPFSHVEQAWDAVTGAAAGGFPKATDDFQLVSQASIAKVAAGPGPDRQVLVGTGLYNLHAYGLAGLEPSGWPKFTGGWMQATPAVGDADGDGDLDVTTVTREGWSFLWGTDAGTCSGTNNEWWTYHHDEHSTNRYGADGRPPGVAKAAAAPNTVGEITAVRETDDDVALGFIAPGDDWLCGQATNYRILVSPNPIEHASDGTVVAEGAASNTGTPQPVTSLTPAQVAGQNYVAVLYRDDVFNWGLLASDQIPAAGGGGGTDSDGDTFNDDVDNCPAQPNMDQADADGDDTGDVCEPDTDGDGVSDDNGPADTDNCVNTPNADQADADADDIGDACEGDADGDGVSDDNGPGDTDNCVNDSNPGQANNDNDAQGDVCDPDDDNDTVNDTADNCVTSANTDQADTDKDGIGNACDPTDNRPAPGACTTTTRGTGGADRLTGTAGSDRIVGLRGNDTLLGLAGDDCLLGNKGTDRINGGAGADQLSGGNRPDRITGGAGADTIRAGNAGDVVKSKDGEADTVDCGGGVDKVKADPRDKLTNCETSKNRRKKSAKP